jgi:hypothetical protein
MLNKLVELKNDQTLTGGQEIGVALSIREVLQIPAADVVEVVRCKDCEHYKQNPWNKETDMLCQCYSDWHSTEPNDFCSYGERKEKTT